MSEAENPGPSAYCDLVMKGGITSGVVYPPLVDELAKHYRFKNIGGTSAGAIAAAATAAAEYRRRVGVGAAFPRQLGELPQELAATIDGGSKLFSLFQAEPGGCRRLFRVLTTALNARGTWKRVLLIAAGVLWGYWIATAVSLAVSVWIGLRFGSLDGCLSAILLLPISIGLWIYHDFTRSLVGNGYGMCTGMRASGYQQEALTPWLHGLIQNLSGKPLDDPLTFEDLWKAPGFPPHDMKDHCGDVRSINLRMFTTNLSTGRPFILPLNHETCRLFYQADELRRYLPVEVMDFMTGNSIAYSPSAESDPPIDKMRELNLDLRELAPAKWPVVLAARLSLSFPILFSAIPLWAIDYDAPRGRRTFTRCLFSDGGIASNFPIHMFDSLLPRWPTFGAQLEPKLKDRPDMVYLPERYAEGYGERWNRFDEHSRVGARAGGFLSAIISAMQNWNDNTTSRMPGVRDRVVRVRLSALEGGMNLNMEPALIMEIAERGRAAAQELIQRFVPPAIGWRDQRWYRFRVALDALRERFCEVQNAVGRVDPEFGTYEDLIRLAASEKLDGQKRCLTDTECQALADALASMAKFNASISGSSFSARDFDVIPSTDLKVRPAL